MDIPTNICIAWYYFNLDWKLWKLIVYILWHLVTPGNDFGVTGRKKSNKRFAYLIDWRELLICFNPINPKSSIEYTNKNYFERKLEKRKLVSILSKVIWYAMIKY